MCAETRLRFADYVNSLTTPLVGDIDPYAQRDPGQDDAAAVARGAADADSDDEAEGEGGGGDAAAAGGSADGDFVRRGKADVVCNGVSRQQREFLAQVVADRASGKRPSYEDAERLDVQPPDPLCMPCFDADVYHLLPIHFWSPGVKWSLAMPCHNHGWSHSRYVNTYPAWHQRRVCGIVTDFTIAGNRTECSECKAEYVRTQKLLDAAKSHNPRAPRVAELEAKLAATGYYSNTLDARVNKFLFERYPGLAVAMPAVLSHRKGVSTELMAIVARAARTPQGSHDLEAALREYRSIESAKARLSFYWQQRRQQRVVGGVDGDVKEYDVGVSQVSDTFLAEVLDVYYDSHETYLRQWTEQHVR